MNEHQRSSGDLTLPFYTRNTLLHLKKPEWNQFTDASGGSISQPVSVKLCVKAKGVIYS